MRVFLNKLFINVLVLYYLSLKKIILRAFLFKINDYFVITLSKNIQYGLIFVKANIICNQKVLIDLIIIDRPDYIYRYTIVYILSHTLLSTQMFLCIFCKELESTSSVTKLFNSSFWLEREAWDLYGIYFFNNLDLRKLLTNYGYKSHPLKKTFPLTGFTETRYVQLSRKLECEKLTVNQKYRKLKK